MPTFYFYFEGVINNKPIFVGGDTQFFYHDMQFKVANSVAENPNKIFYQDVDLSALPNPSTGWTEITNQADIDKVKSQDNTVLTYSTTTANKAKAIMMAVDLTTVCNTLYGGSNSALVTALKAIQVDVWASGSGASSGATANGVSVYVWDISTNAWITNNYSNTQSTIQQITAILSNISTKVDSSNKIYILIVSQYPSDGTIASTVNLDYIRVRVDLSRSVDIVNPISIYVPNIWTILIRGFSPSWDSATSKDGRRIFKLYNGTYYIEFYYDAVNDRFVLNRKNSDGTFSTLYSNSNEIFANWQIINFLIEQTPTGLRFRMLKNNGTVEVYTLQDSKPLSGNMNLYLLSSDTQGYEADAFIDSFVFIPNQNYDDNTVAEDILRGNITGLASGFDFAELIQSNDFSDATKWTLSGNASISNKTLTLPDVQDTAQQDINVLPNNKYHIDLKTQTSQGVAEVKEYYNNLYIRSTLLGAGLNDFVTSPNTNKISVLLKNQLQGFSRNSPAFLSDGTQVTANTPRLETGQFGRAIMIEEGTTNVFGSGSRLDTDSNGDGLADNVVVYTLISSYSMVTDSWLGTKSQRAVSSGSGNSRLQYNIAQTVSAGQIWTVSIRGKAQAGKKLFIVVKDQTDNLFTGSFKTQVATGEWDLITHTFTIPAGVTSIRIQFGLADAVAGDWFQYCALQLEQKPYATTFIDSTRSPEFPTIPTAGVLNPQEGTIEFWVKLNTLNSSGYNAFFTAGDVSAPGPRILIMRDFVVNPNKIMIWDGDGSTESMLTSLTTLQAGTWYYVAFTWSPSGRKLYVNGVLEASNTRSNSLGFATLAKIGSWLNIGYLNGLIDDLRISNRARTDAEIAAAYASGLPLPVDSDTTLKMDFDNLGNAIFNNVSLKLKM